MVLTIIIVINRRAFQGHAVQCPVGQFWYPSQCVWYGLRDTRSKAALYPVYGRELEKLFKNILGVPNATSAEVRECLARLMTDTTTTMAQVTEVHLFLQTHCAQSLVQHSIVIDISLN